MKKSSPMHILSAVKRVWSELDYVQRRMFEIHTGVSVTTPQERLRRAGG
jgi:hypothetical protein